ncbi:MAG: hypothetical protein JSV49_03535 [Thermoplasmata archaeon]|nr:MAG: hypothetical protein JSV49_03535 [Thermoplasmata archaeon]
MRAKSSHYLLKISVVSIVFLILLLPCSWCDQARGSNGGAVKDMVIQIHNWKSVSVNFTETTTMIDENPVDFIRAQADFLGDNNSIVDDIDASLYERTIEYIWKMEYIDNPEDSTDLFFGNIMIDGSYGTINRTNLYFGNLQGPVTSIEPVLYSREIFYDYNNTDLTKSTHNIKATLGMGFGEEQTSFNQYIIKLPDDWMFDTVNETDYPPLIFYNQNRLINITDQIYNENLELEDYLKTDGITCVRYQGPPDNDVTNGNEDSEEEKEDDEKDILFLSYYEFGFIIAIIIICLIAVILISRRVKAEEALSESASKKGKGKKGKGKEKEKEEDEEEEKEDKKKKGKKKDKDEKEEDERERAGKKGKGKGKKGKDKK